jgi:hypothetical protein
MSLADEQKTNFESVILICAKDAIIAIIETK